ncbi:hypothetical protein [Gynurincola endophyticus]|uniref:hypothetical protein n=1 Tax=Gynurincola endophyticus TaxID=2479004 RepID=UPI000F8C3D46|nr:hypothetical protein [Gynurincola endophyticus]
MMSLTTYSILAVSVGSVGCMNEGSVHQKVKYFQFWKYGTRCRVIDDTKVFEQILDWLHQQPVCEGLVWEAIY